MKEICNICGQTVEVACDDLELAQDIECGNLPTNLRQSEEEYEKESEEINEELRKKTGKNYFW